ncbi:NAD dependent epimerase dehydratase family protein [Colletotrichum higginsianum]|nr:NAD dependent epimerase dehydratase family protein [Colletotrichum higginsianum]
MSKALEGGGDPPPPSYSEATTSNPSSSSYNPGSSVSATLEDLSSLLRVTQSQQTARDTITTTTLLPLLTPHVTSLLNRLGRTPHPPALTELYLVPAAAVGPQWSITSDADRRAGEVAQVIRVEPEPDLGSKGAGDSKRAVPDAGLSAASSSRDYEFDEWGRWDDDDAAASTPKEGWWWWNDEALARRLAKLLQPEPRLDRTVVSAVMEQAKEERKAGGWGCSGPEPSLHPRLPGRSLGRRSLTGRRRSGKKRTSP